VNTALADARHTLAGSVRALVDELVVREMTPAGLIERRAPSLLDQLAASVGVGSERGGGGGSSGGSRVLIDPTAHALLLRIGDHARTELWRTEPGVAYVGRTVAARVAVPELSTAERIRRCARYVAAVAQAPADLAWLSHRLGEWATDIRNLLDPRRRARPLPGIGCPACSVEWTHRADDAGETVRVPALALWPNGETHCLACEHYWPLTDMDSITALMAAAYRAGLGAAW
jgi:hypothetical protein